MHGENYNAALACAMTALDALGRARSFGNLLVPGPTSDAIFQAEEATRDAIHKILEAGREAGQIS